MEIITNILTKKSFFYAALLVIGGFVLYASDLQGVLFLDDYSFLVYNTFVHDLSWNNVANWFTQNAIAGAGRVTDYYRPLLLFSFALNYAVGKLNPFGYHLVNNIIHIANGIIIFYILSWYVFKKQWMAFLAALIFLIHPAQSENVVYVPSRGDLLSSLFMLLGLLFWLKGLEVKKYLYGTLSIVSLFLALLSRENAIIFPFLALVFYISFISKENFLTSIKQGFFKLIPHGALVVLYLILRLTVLNFRNFLNFGNYDSGSLYAQSLFVRFFTFMHAFLEYLKNIFFPINIYQKLTFPISASFFSWPVWFSFIILVALFVLIVVLYQKNKGAHFNMWFFGWGWFFAALLPSVGIIPVNVIMMDHFTYLALIGVFIICIWYFDMLLTYLKLHRQEAIRTILIIGVAAYLSFFSFVTVQRIIIWGNPEKLLQETITHEPGATIAYEELGAFYFNTRNYPKAQEYFSAAIEKGARTPELFYVMGDLQYIYGPEKNVDKAVLYYKKAIEIAPSYQAPYQRLVELYMEQGDTQAIPYLKKMNEFNPTDINVYYNLAMILHLIGENRQAIVWVEKGLLLTQEGSPVQKTFLDLRKKILSFN